MNLEEIKQKIKDLGDEFSGLGTKKEIKYLPDILEDEEEIIAMTSGSIGMSTWLIVATQKRIIMLDKGFLYGLKQKEIPLKNISAIEIKTGLLFGEIEINSGSSKIKVENIEKKTVAPFAKKVNKLIHG